MLDMVNDMASRAKLTLITPTFNQADFLAETLDSVLAQTFQGFVYRVIDDGSTDATPAVLQRYAGRVSWARQSNRGQVRTLNQAWLEAETDYIGYLSSDDLLLPDALGALVAHLDAHPEVVCVFPDSDLIDEKSHVIRRGVCRPFDLAHTLVTHECHIGPGAVFRRSAFVKLGGWCESMRLAPDREFWMRLALQGRIDMLPRTLARYRTHPAATSFRAATAQVSLEYLTALDRFYASEGVPVALQVLAPEARARAHLLMARNALWRWEWRMAWQLFDEALAMYPSLSPGAERWKLLRAGLSRHVKVAYTRLIRVVS